MKHFFVNIEFIVPPHQFESVVQSHRDYIHSGYSRGMILMSGPKNPRTGGLMIARAESLEVLQQFFQQDPYALLEVAKYNITEFNPVMFQPFLQDWIGN